MGSAVVTGLAAAGLVSVAATCASAQQCNPTWQSLGSGMNSTVYSLYTLDGGDLVAGGNFSIAGGVPAQYLARWNGSSWSSLASGMNGSVAAVTALANGDIVAGGAFNIASGASANYIARWNGSSWLAMGTGMGDGFAPVNALTVLPGGDLIAGGQFTTAGGASANYIARWNGSSWSALGSGMGGVQFPSVLAVAALPNGDVVAGGDFLTAGDVPAGFIARWDGSSWSALGSGMGDGFAAVNALVVLPGGDFIAGGSFTSAGGLSASHIARWNGSSWSALGLGLNGVVTSVATLLSGDVIAAGQFTTAGGTTANNIARWDGASWSPLGTGINSLGANALATLPTGELAAGGNFSAAGGVPESYIARYVFGGSPTISGQPTSNSACPSGTASFSVTAAAVGPFTYQWQIETSPGAWTNLTTSSLVLACGGSAHATAPNASQSDIGVAPCAGVSAYVVRCVVSNACGSLASNEATYAVCYPNCDCSSSSPVLNVNDFTCFLQKFATGNAYANCDGSTSIPQLNVTDFTCFLQKFAQGCP